jgi:hypothetical protein
VVETELTRLVTSRILHDLSPRDTITQIKAAAIRQFAALDSRMKIHSTEYFNHSFAPDLVLTWRTSRETERYVYMRSASDHEDLAADVLRLGGQKPIVLGLNPVYREIGDHEKVGISLNRLAQDRDTLVTDASALASVVRAKLNKPITSLFSTALAQAGRGLVDSDDAETTTAVIASGFDAARGMGADSVLRAVTAVDDHLAVPFANRFNRILEAVWVGSGGRADLFPRGQLDLTAGVDDEALEFLLDLDVIDDYDFWRRIGRTTTVSQIGKLSPRQPNDNMQHLVKANLDHLTARACRVQDRQERMEEQEQPDLWWLTENHALALRSRSWTAFIAERAEELSGIEGTATKGVSIADLIDRAGTTVLTGVEMSDGTYQLDLSSSTQADVAHSDHLDAVARSFGSTARVQRARAMTDNRQVACDFTKSSASATTSSVVPVTELLGVSLPLLRPMQPSARAALLELLTPLVDPDALPLEGPIKGNEQLAFPIEHSSDSERPAEDR